MEWLKGQAELEGPEDVKDMVSEIYRRGCEKAIHCGCKKKKKQIKACV